MANIIYRRMESLPTVREEDESERQTTVIAYEPVRSTNYALQRRRSLPVSHPLHHHHHHHHLPIRRQSCPNGHLKVCKAKMTLSFSLYVVTGGTLLTMGTFFLSGILFIIALLALGFSAFLACTWFCFSKALNLVSSATQKLAPKPLPSSPPQERSLQHVD